MKNIGLYYFPSYIERRLIYKWLPENPNEQPEAPPWWWDWWEKFPPIWEDFENAIDWIAKEEKILKDKWILTPKTQQLLEESRQDIKEAQKRDLDLQTIWELNDTLQQRSWSQMPEQKKESVYFKSRKEYEQLWRTYFYSSVIDSTVAPEMIKQWNAIPESEKMSEKQLCLLVAEFFFIHTDKLADNSKVKRKNDPRDVIRGYVQKRWNLNGTFGIAKMLAKTTWLDEYKLNNWLMQYLWIDISKLPKKAWEILSKQIPLNDIIDKKDWKINPDKFDQLILLIKTEIFWLKERPAKNISLANKLEGLKDSVRNNQGTHKFIWEIINKLYITKLDNLYHLKKREKVTQEIFSWTWEWLANIENPKMIWRNLEIHQANQNQIEKINKTKEKIKQSLEWWATWFISWALESFWISKEQQVNIIEEIIKDDWLISMVVKFVLFWTGWIFQWASLFGNKEWLSDEIKEEVDEAKEKIELKSTEVRAKNSTLDWIFKWTWNNKTPETIKSKIQAESDNSANFKHMMQVIEIMWTWEKPRLNAMITDFKEKKELKWKLITFKFPTPRQAYLFTESISNRDPQDRWVLDKITSAFKNWFNSTKESETVLDSQWENKEWNTSSFHNLMPKHRYSNQRWLEVDLLITDSKRFDWIIWWAMEEFNKLMGKDW